MNKKAIIVLPAMAFTIFFSSSNEVNTFLGINPIYITYHSTSDGYFDEGNNVKTEKKSFKIRRGVEWGRRNVKEKPTEDPIAYDSDSLSFTTYCDKYGNPIEDSYVIQSNTDVYASYGYKETWKDFDRDNWAQLASVTAQGLDATLATYNHDADWFIGRTKKLNLGSVEYTARVIGVNHDELADGTGNAVFTFEFVETIDPKPYALEMSKTNNYKSSYLRNYLNGVFKNQFSTGLKRAMKLVKKTTNIGGGDSNVPSTGKFEELDANEYIFPISLKEMNASKYNEKLSSATYKFPDNEIDEEGKVYEYYNKSDVSSLPNISKLNKSSNSYLPYWTRSPELHANQYTWFVNCSNSTNYEIGRHDETYYDEQESMPVSTSIAIAPCFCI